MNPTTKSLHLAAIYTVYGKRAGAELFAEKTLEEIRRLEPDWRLTVFCNGQAREILSERLPGADLRHIPWLDHQIKKAFWLEFLSHRWVTRRNFDVFWLPSASASFPGRWDVPSVATFLDLGGFLVHHRWSFQRSIYTKYISTPRTLRRAAAFTAISQTTADDLLRVFPRARPARVIYLGPSPRSEAVPPGNPQEVIERETGLKLSSILFSPARTDYLGKGRDILLRAYAQYRRSVPEPLPLVMPGPPGAFHPRFLADIAALQLSDCAFWPGRVSDACIEAFYQISRAMLMPSRTEGFGFPILEAMERGVPVICSDAGSLPEVAADAALVVPAGSVEKLAEAMVNLETQPTLRQELIRRGHNRCRAFSWERTARQYCDLFKAVAAQEPPRENRASNPTP